MKIFAKLFFISLTVAFMLTCSKNEDAVESEANPAKHNPLAPTVSKVDENANDYDAIIRESDNWDIRLNVGPDYYYYTKYSGDLTYTWGGNTYTGAAYAIYDKAKETILVTAMDGRHEENISYSLTFTGTTSMSGTWVYFHPNCYARTIGAALISGTIGSHSAGGLARLAPESEPANMKHPKRHKE